MDKVNIIKQKFSRMTIKKAMVCIYLVTVCVICILSSAAVFVCSHFQQELSDHRSILIKNAAVSEQLPDGGYTVDLDNSNIQRLPLKGKQKFLFITVSVLMFALPVFFIIAGIITGTKICLELKIRKPVEELNLAIHNIQNKDLDFSIKYSSTDELGQLCASMEQMKNELLLSSKKQWDMMQQRKLLNESAAHDLRTPITVINGYIDYIDSSNKSGKLSGEDLTETLSDIKDAVNRMQRYVDSIKDIETLDSIAVISQPVSTGKLYDEIRNTAAGLNAQTQITVNNNCPQQIIQTDRQLLMRIIENLLSNAVRYAKHTIDIDISSEDIYLSVTVTDDGDGFSNTDLEKACAPFYSRNKDSIHFGIGLSICSVLAQKLGGEIILSNSKNSGAAVRVKIKK